MVKKVGAITHSIGICYPPYRLGSLEGSSLVKMYKGGTLFDLLMGLSGTLFPSPVRHRGYAIA